MKIFTTNNGYGPSEWLFLVSIAVGFAALCMWAGMRYVAQVKPKPAPPVANGAVFSEISSLESPGSTGSAGADPGEIPLTRMDRAALRYATACQETNCEVVIAMTLWMKDRLSYVRTQHGEGEEVAQARLKLCEDLSDRRTEGNQLTPEGIEDKYLFSPHATIRFAGRGEEEAGTTKMEASVVWLEVEYAEKRHAVRDRDGRPVQSLRVGVHVSPDGDIIKAGILGNTAIDWDSISYWWLVSDGAT